MRIKLILKCSGEDVIIPINYQYYISSFIYRCINSSDNEFSEWLHNSGFTAGGKNFKLFTFSNLYIPQREIHNSELIIKSKKIELLISMMSEKIYDNLIIGMFRNQTLDINHREINASFPIQSVELLPEPEFTDKMKFRTITPVVISKSIEYMGKHSESYMMPTEKDYFYYLKKNIEDKYIAYASNLNTPIVEYPIKDFQVGNSVKSKLITVHEGRREETKVKGYMYDFVLEGAPELMNFAYSVGIGKLSSLGFGCIKPIYN